MKKVWLCILLCINILFISRAATLTGIRAYNDVGHTRIVLDMMDRPGTWDVDYDGQAYTLHLTLPDTVNRNTEPVRYQGEGGILKGVLLMPKGNDLEITLQTKQGAMHNLFVLTDPERMVIDLFTNYEQKVTTALSPNLTYTRWEKSNQWGRLKISVIKVGKDSRIELQNEYKADDNSQQAPLVIQDFAAEKEEIDASHIGLEGVLTYDMTEGFKIERRNYDIQVRKERDALTTGFVNQVRGQDSLVVYNHLMGDRTGTNVYGRELVIRKGKVVAVGQGNSLIGKEDFVLSGHGKAEMQLQDFKQGDTVEVSVTALPLLHKSAQIYGEGQILLADKRIIASEQDEISSKMFWGTDGKGDAWLVLVEGQTPSSEGVSKHEGAKILLELGATDGLVLSQENKPTVFIKGKPIDDGKSHRKKTNGEALLLS